MRPPISSASAAGSLIASRRVRGLRRPGPRLLAGAAVMVIAAIAVVLVVASPFTTTHAPGTASVDNGSPTSLYTVKSEPLSSQTQVSGTLGYADPSSVVVPAGIAPSDLRQAQQSLASAQAAQGTAEATLSSDSQALQQAEATLTADRQKLTSDCRGDKASAAASAGTGSSSPSAAAGSGSDGSSSTAVGSGAGTKASTGAASGSSSSCATAAQALISDQQSVHADKQKVIGDNGTASSARATLSGAEQTAASNQASATANDPTASYTMLPEPGKVIRRGQPLYAVDSRPVLLLYGSVTAWQAFRPGMPGGRDVAELNANLEALGYGTKSSGDSFTASTEQAIKALQAAHGLAQTGELPLGSVVFKPGPVLVTSVTPTVGQLVQPGPVLTVTSIRHQVTVELDASLQSEVKAGDAVTITLPNNRTTPGVVTSVGTVATTSSSSGSGSASGGSGSTSGSGAAPTVQVDIELSRQAAAGSIDQAPVQVSITTAKINRALVVPVDALLALAGGGYAVEVVSPVTAHRLVPVTVGLFDDADGLVQVNGSGVHAGEHVMVPSS